MRWTREQYLELMTFSHSPRPMFVELFGPLIGLDAEWRAQGASEDEIAMVAFDWDYVPAVSCGGREGAEGSAPQTVEENDEFLIQRDYLGRTTKLCKKTATIPLPLDFPVKTMDDWVKLKPMFQFNDRRIDWDQVARARKAQRQGAMVMGSMGGAFDTPRELMGEEVACMSYYEQPELMADIIATMSDTAMRIFERISDTLLIDQLNVHEDFAGKSGPLVGPAQIREYFQPYYRRVWELLSSRGTRIFQQDTDGNVNSVIPALLDCGLTSIYPMEPAAGMDIVQVRKQYGKRVAMLGGIDKHVLRQDKAAILAELEYKMQPMMREGGMVFGLDHRIPNGTPLENYRYYVQIGREILGLPPLDGRSKGWARMAF